MAISYHSVYKTQSITSFQVCRTDDISLYAVHLYDFFESAAFASPSRIALETAHQKITYEALNAKIAACASGLITMGVEPGDFLLFSMKNSLELIVCVLAAFKLGARFCILPEDISALRLQIIQGSLSFALLVHNKAKASEFDMCHFHVRSVSYQEIVENGVYSIGAEDVYMNSSASATQIMVSYDEQRGFYSTEFPQAVFLKMLSELDDVLPAQQSGERMLITTQVTQPLFLLELFCVFMRQSTVVFDQSLASDFSEYPITLPHIGAVRLFLQTLGWMKSCSTGIEIKGLCISLSELEYFAKQYPGVSYARANISEEGLELHVKFSWNFYPYPLAHRVCLTDLGMPQTDKDRLALRLSHFMSQHLWDVPLKSLVLQPE